MTRMLTNVLAALAVSVGIAAGPAAADIPLQPAEPVTTAAPQLIARPSTGSADATETGSALLPGCGASVPPTYTGNPPIQFPWYC